MVRSTLTNTRQAGSSRTLQANAANEPDKSANIHGGSARSCVANQ
eukprot:CAMPEP_0183509614 /NCGR_PEP_ID=MMETSP0371-20130417/9732_1 /TAXON_ID=268820 /ORGANISM="Peridinium aciculiferum, Strain PAER-2" /LENGTH=44 /DNA_ID= /DNA_START= /DNA_END= /DNA_ORIENTATION=